MPKRSAESSREKGQNGSGLGFEAQMFLAAVLATYGHPVRSAKGSASWCNVGTLNSSGVYICAPNSPNLLLKGSELILGDNSVAQRERTAWNAQTTGAPPS